jgi:hypothetical protein
MTGIALGCSRPARAPYELMISEQPYDFEADLAE